MCPPPLLGHGFYPSLPLLPAHPNHQWGQLLRCPPPMLSQGLLPLLPACSPHSSYSQLSPLAPLTPSLLPLAPLGPSSLPACSQWPRKARGMLYYVLGLHHLCGGKGLGSELGVRDSKMGARGSKGSEREQPGARGVSWEQAGMRRLSRMLY